MSMALSSRVKTLTCFDCGNTQPADRLTTVCDECGLPLRVDLDLPSVPAAEAIDTTTASMWRYASALPIEAGDAVTLGEGWTPIIEVEDNVWVKDEAQNPTGSFKSRGMSMAVSAAVQLGASRLVAPSAGNAACALAAYGARAGVPVVVAMPDDTPDHFIKESRHYGAEVHLVEGTISDAGKFLAANRGENDFDVSTLKEPYRVEGKKTMGYELFEQFDGNLPEVVLYPTGGGTGLVGMWKAWNEMEQMGWIDSATPSAGVGPNGWVRSGRQSLRRRRRVHRFLGRRPDHRLGAAGPRADRWLRVPAGDQGDVRDRPRHPRGRVVRANSGSGGGIGHRCLPRGRCRVGGLSSTSERWMDRSGRASRRVQHGDGPEVPVRSIR